MSTAQVNMENKGISGADKKAKEIAGPPTWDVLHYFSASYIPSPETAKALKQLYISISELFPCEMCREHFKINLKKYPIDPYLSNRDDAYFYSYFLHDIVNQSLGKKSPDYKEIKEKTFKAVGQICQSCRIEK